MRLQHFARTAAELLYDPINDDEEDEEDEDEVVVVVVVVVVMMLAPSNDARRGASKMVNNISKCFSECRAKCDDI